MQKKRADVESARFFVICITVIYLACL